MHIIPVLVAALFALPTAANAAPVPNGCKSTTEQFAYLLGEFNEIPTFTGMIGKRDSPVTITIAPSGSWTVVVEPMPGLACLMAAGSGWSPIPISPKTVVPKLEPNGLPFPELWRWGEGNYLRTI